MAELRQSSTQQTSVQLYIDGLNTTSQYTEIYITTNGKTSHNLSRPTGNSSSLYWIVDVLSPGTQYFATYTLRTSAGSTGSGNGFFYTADPPLPNPPGNPSGVSYTPLSSSEIYLSWSRGSGADSYSINVTRASNGDLVWYDYGITGTGVTVYGLTSGVAYNVFIYSVNSGGTSSGVYLNNVRTIEPPTNPTNFRVYDKSNQTINFAWNSVSGANGYSLEIYHASTGALVWNSYNQSSTSATATGLTNGVSYNAKLYATNNGGNSSGVWLYGVQAGYSRPSNWSWSVVKGKGRSYSIVNDRITNLVTYDEIIEFQSRINEFRLYKNLDVYAFTGRTRGQVFTATIYNQLRAAIVGMSPPTQPVSSTNLIDLLNGLRDSLNSIG